MGDLDVVPILPRSEGLPSTTPEARIPIAGLEKWDCLVDSC